MIEVEKQFNPTEEQLQSLLKGAEFLGEKTNHDIYYDYVDYRLFKKDMRLRYRDGSFELKIGESAGVSKEIQTKEEIEKYFNTDNIDEFVKNNLILFIDYSAKRLKYRKGNFNISVDEMSYGYKICEIELMVEKEDQVKNAEDEIADLARMHNIELKKVHTKREEYFRKVKPDVYNELYGEKR